MHILLAIGQVDSEIVNCVNEVITTRLLESQTWGAQEPTKTRPLTRSEREKSEQLGVLHKTSRGKQLREYAQSLTKKWNKFDDQWRQGTYRGTRAEYDQLVTEWHRAWDEAERVSEAAGHRFKDRYGQYRCEEPCDLVSIALRDWCRINGLVYC